MTRWLRLALRLIMGGIFVYAAYTKLRHPWGLFALTIDSYQLLPTWAVLLVARTLPWVELLLGIALIAGVFLRWSSSAVTAILAGFIVLLARSYVKGMTIDCGCFGAGEPLSKYTLLRDSLMFAASVTLTVLAFRDKPKRLAGIM